MRRVPEVIDCWFDSGAMPFAQWGYPHQDREKFREQFPGRFHQRGDRPDPRLVLQPVGDQHAACSRDRRLAQIADLAAQGPVRIRSATASCWG